MSHFSGFVAITPDCDMSLEECLEQYDEQREVEEYIAEDVDDYEKAEFLASYNEEKVGSKESIGKKFYDACHDKEGFFTKENLAEHWCRSVDSISDLDYFKATPYWNKNLYADWFKTTYPEIWEKFDECYEENGQEWNGNSCRYHEGKLVRFSTYNPDSKWDWYDECGRWSNEIKTKSGEYVNECLVEELDLTPFAPEDYCKRAKKDFWGKKYYPLKKKVKYHFTSESVPYCIVVDGKWCERGQMGWWGISTNEKDNWEEQFMEIINSLPEGTQIYNIDFHI